MLRRARRWLAVALLLAVSPLAYLATAPVARAATRCPSAGYGVRRTAPGRGRTVALTFDDGPGHATGRILSILAANHVAATFFNLGDNERVDPAAVRTEQRAGYPIGDHTWDHQDLTTLGASGQAGEIDRERAEQSSITGSDPCLLRPPYGSFDATTLALAQQRGMQVWNWSVDPEDWKADGSGAPYWVHRIRSRAEAGGRQEHPVILFHNQPAGNPATVAALPDVIRFYRLRGYRFVDLLGHVGRPYVQSLSARSGGTGGGTRVTISGANLSRITAVRFGRYAATSVQVESSSRLSVRAPRHAAGIYNVYVYTSHGRSNAHPATRFRYVEPPRSSRLSVHHGPAAGGTRVRISGERFTGGTQISFGSQPARSVQIVSSQEIWVTSPPHVAGEIRVWVHNHYGVLPRATAPRFTYLASGG